MFTNDRWKTDFLNRIHSAFPELSCITIQHRTVPIDITLSITLESSIEVVDHLKIICCADRDSDRFFDDLQVLDALFDRFSEAYLKHLSDHKVDRSKLCLED